jgi:hypothetical protein
VDVEVGFRLRLREVLSRRCLRMSLSKSIWCGEVVGTLAVQSGTNS